VAKGSSIGACRLIRLKEPVDGKGGAQLKLDAQGSPKVTAEYFYSAV